MQTTNSSVITRFDLVVRCCSTIWFFFFAFCNGKSCFILLLLLVNGIYDFATRQTSTINYKRSENIHPTDTLHLILYSYFFVPFCNHYHKVIYLIFLAEKENIFKPNKRKKKNCVIDEKNNK